MRKRISILVVIILTGSAFRAYLLHQDLRFHPDEAFFAAFARDAAVRGEWWLGGDLDKTPLTIYGQAVSMLLVGIEWDGAVWRLPLERGEFGARLLGFYSGVVLIAVTAWAARGRSKRAGEWVIAPLLVALSPYLIAFSPTAFTDMPMVLAVLLAVGFAMRGRGAAAGIWLMIGYGCKQQAVLIAPVIVWLVAAQAVGRRRLIAFAGSLVIGGALLGAWEIVRPFPPVTLLAAGNNAPAGWALSGQVLIARGGAWLGIGRWLFGVGWVTVIVGIAALMGRKRYALRVFVVGYLLLHWLLPFNVYDRYLLLVIPLMALLAAPTLAGWVDRRWWIAPVVLVGMVSGAWGAARGALPIGGDRGQHAGIMALADHLNGREFGAIVYDHWLGWELNYYLGGWSDKRRAFYPSPEAMIADRALYVPDAAPRYLPAPVGGDYWAWRDALHGVGFRTTIGYQSERFVVIVIREGLEHPPDAQQHERLNGGLGAVDD